METWRNKLAVVGLCATTIVGMVSLVDAPRASADNSTRGFQIVNTTANDVKYVSAGGSNGPCNGDVLDGGGPQLGSVLHPGDDLDFEVVFHLDSTTWCNLYFDVLDKSGNKIAQFVVNVGVNGDYTPYAQDTHGTTPGWSLGILQGYDKLGHYITTVEMNAPSTTKPATWMHDLAPQIQNRRLSDIVIPGSHDSTTYSLHPEDPTGLSITQSEDLTAQLNDGIRDFDVRVEYRGENYYAHHGTVGSAFDIVSPSLSLSDIFGEIGQWALSPGHQQEVILLDLSIDGVDEATFPRAYCLEFGQLLGDALVTPRELEAANLPTDPGQVKLGQLWSLPDSKGAARVILDNTECMDAAAAGAGQWSPNPPFGQGPTTSYYANQTTADGDAGTIVSPTPDEVTGIKKLVLAAVKSRATDGNGSVPTAIGPPMQGGLYTLFIQGSPTNDALIPPQGMIPDEKEVLAALYRQWGNDPSTHANLNIVSGDFVQETDLVKDVLAMDMASASQTGTRR